MAKIQVLDKHMAELIAAGEVVERPSSVIKELVENCVDAGATSISVEIKNGGISFMSVSDNGEGMAREDVPIAFLRHATSKVHTAGDLDAISTLGFRGEALASIAAVSRVELTTRREEELAGTRYTLEGGDPGELEDIGCPKGTVITVRDLFYNVPARMKFLKKDVSEGNAVAAVMDRLALSHPDIAFCFVRDGREELHTSGDGDLRGCIYSVLGRDFSNRLIPVEYTLDGIAVNGFISSPSASRANRTMQYFFVNGRYVKTRTAMAALEQAYKGSIMTGRFPAGVLFLNMPCEIVDANVHPAKVEIRFIDERPVFSAVFHAVKSALEESAQTKSVSLPKPPSSSVGSQLKLDFQKPLDGFGMPASDSSPVIKKTFSPDIVCLEPLASEKSDSVLTMRDMSERWGDLQQSPAGHLPEKLILDSCGKHVMPSTSHIPGAVEETASFAPSAKVRIIEEEKERPAVIYIGELFKTYLLAEMGGDFYIIDKHAAHERLIYNHLTAAEHADSQQLLAPVSVTLGREEYAALIPELPTLAKAGFEVEEFGGREVLVRAVPMLLSGCDISAAVQEMAGGFAEGGKMVKLSPLDWIYHSTACRAAVKAGDESRPAELARFAQRILLNDDIRTCPHGRPVCFSLTKQEIEKQFGRIV